jgi:hypothetical protein
VRSGVRNRSLWMGPEFRSTSLLYYFQKYYIQDEVTTILSSRDEIWGVLLYYWDSRMVFDDEGKKFAWIAFHYLPLSSVHSVRSWAFVDISVHHHRPDENNGDFNFLRLHNPPQFHSPIQEKCRITKNWSRSCVRPSPVTSG